MRRLVVPLVLLLLLATVASAQNVRLARTCAHITSATTTTLVAATSGVSIELWSFFIYVDNGGVATTVTLRDSAGTNLAGTNVAWPLAAGSSFTGAYRGQRYFNATAAGTGLQIVTSAAGPVEACVETVQ